MEVDVDDAIRIINSAIEFSIESDQVDLLALGGCVIPCMTRDVMKFIDPNECVVPIPGFTTSHAYFMGSKLISIIANLPEHMIIDQYFANSSGMDTEINVATAYPLIFVQKSYDSSTEKSTGGQPIHVIVRDYFYRGLHLDHSHVEPNRANIKKFTDGVSFRLIGAKPHQIEILEPRLILLYLLVYFYFLPNTLLILLLSF